MSRSINLIIIFFIIGIMLVLLAACAYLLDDDWFSEETKNIDVSALWNWDISELYDTAKELCIKEVGESYPCMGIEYKNLKGGTESISFIFALIDESQDNVKELYYTYDIKKQQFVTLINYEGATKNMDGMGQLVDPHEWNADFKKIMDDLNTRFGNIYSIYMGSNYWAVNYERDSTTRGTAYVKFNSRMYQIE